MVINELFFVTKKHRYQLPFHENSKQHQKQAQDSQIKRKRTQEKAIIRVSFGTCLISNMLTTRS